ncbi:hypothetical protein FH972_025439 [Carpinus fangiana]|uniref:Peptidase A1 domain-containing protein n=1 Tax=Carpinus fangiana TaxID=176857 RepID=A0A5N6L1A1_9ROSI|nr:hypothetical protein FH972_025439 [Carpinus fangiana]
MKPPYKAAVAASMLSAVSAQEPWNIAFNGSGERYARLAISMDSNQFNDRDSATTNPSTWNVHTADLLNYTGGGRFSMVRVKLQPSSIQNDTNHYYLDHVSAFKGLDVSSAFPGGPAYSYTPDIGLANTTLAAAYGVNAIPSVSFGLHIGSALPSAVIPGSLYLGGYDSARVLSAPAVGPTTADSFSLQLIDIAFGISNGSSPFANVPSGSIPGLLQYSKGQRAGPTDVAPDPAIPYLYLPSATCDAIARNIPVTYSPDLNLYLWNTSDPSYAPLLASTTFLAFVFNSGSSTGNVTINLPLALLNLNLEYPVVNVSIPYFPCRPYDNPTGANIAYSATDSRQNGSEWAGYRLGRAFLQAAFLAINWQSNTVFLAQAPGPSLPHSAPLPVAIAGSDTALQPLSNSPTWADTWADTLHAYSGPQYMPSDVAIQSLTPSAIAQPGDQSSAQSSAQSSTPPSAQPSSSAAAAAGLSTGAIAGIVVGIIGAIIAAMLVLAIVVLRRRRAPCGDGTGAGGSSTALNSRSGWGSELASSAGDVPLYEVDGVKQRREMDGVEGAVHEMDVRHSRMPQVPVIEEQRAA